MFFPAYSGKRILRKRDGSYRFRRRTIVLAGLGVTVTFCFLNLYGAAFGMKNSLDNFGNFLPAERNVDSTAISERLDEDVIYFDQFAMMNVRATLQSAYSYVEWHAFSFGDVRVKDNLTQFQTAPLVATVDRRPLTAKRQMVLDEDGLHNNGKLLGCAMTGVTFVSNLEFIYRKFEDLPVRCDLCIQFASRQDSKVFLEDIGYEILDSDQTTTATRCINGKARLNARFPQWQRNDERFKGFGYPWTVDCALPNGIKELTCEEITKLQDDSLTTGGVQKIYFETNIALDGYFSTSSPKTFNVVTRWPWDALRSHDDNRSHFATSLPEAWNDDSSTFVPSSYKTLKLAHAEGPGYSKIKVDGETALESMLISPNSHAAVHKRLITNLFHLIRNAPNSTHILAVVDGQAHQSYKRIVNLLNTKVIDLYPQNSNAILAHYDALKDMDYIPVAMMDRNAAEVKHLRDKVTLRDLLFLRGIKIHMVPLTTPSIAFEKNVCGIQYAFTAYLAARFAADYHVMMYIDGDTAMIERSETMQEIYYKRFFSEQSTKCVGHRFRLLEQYVNPDDDNIDRVLKCLDDLAIDRKRWDYVVKNCHLKEGHVVARTDSIYEFNVHHPDTLDDYLPNGVKNCITPGNKITDEYFLTANEIVQVHLRDRERKPECACFAVIP